MSYSVRHAYKFATSDDASQAVEQAKAAYNAYNRYFAAQPPKISAVEQNKPHYRAYNQSAAQRLAVLSNNGEHA